MSDPTQRIAVRTAVWADDEATLRRLREQVFVDEQKVPADLEWDGKDAACEHALAWLNGRCIGTGRLEPDGKIGRMAVLADARGAGVGAAILTHLVDVARGRGLARVYLHAQAHALDFYARQGFVASGPEFDEAGIAHRFMERQIS